MATTMTTQEEEATTPRDVIDAPAAIDVEVS